jgi:threonyl-tRNA synthetase
VTNLTENCKAIDQKNLVMTYQGKANTGFFVDVLHHTENKLEKIEPQVKLRKKIFNILVEVIQNIHHYFEEYKNEGFDCPVSISIYRDNKDYFVCTGNQIKNEKVIKLKLLLDKINALNKEQLVNLYREKLLAGIAKSGRAGLGILDIKRKAGANIHYKFELLNNQYSYFSLIVRVIA